ncbi:MAG: aldehyde reductase [Mangrovibacterium sp.]|nr:aldehyde reductase [Mangrovibacterium sp.]
MGSQRPKRVLLTGVSGFLGSHTAIQLLEKEYEVVGTLRELKRADEISGMIARHTAKVGALKFVKADLLDEQIWKVLTKGVDFVQHVASPFPRELPRHEEDLIRPAREGALNVLKAASANGVKRVVLTSSIAAVMYGRERGKQSAVYDESNWTDVSNRSDTTPYYRSKTLAERAAWDFMASDKSGMELVSVCPGAILGPVLERDFGTSANMVIKMLDGSMPAFPKLGFEIVDVRSVADLLIRAMEMPQAANQRFLGTSGYAGFADIARILREAWPDRKIPSRSVPSFLVVLLSLFDKTLRPVLKDLDTTRRADHSKAVDLLQWQPIPNEEAILSCARSLIDLEIVRV